jgi:hypothetical protein
MSAPPHSASPAASQTPSFSIVVETENLAFEGSDALARCLECLRHQDLDFAKANEVVTTLGTSICATRSAAQIRDRRRGSRGTSSQPSASARAR